MQACDFQQVKAVSKLSTTETRNQPEVAASEVLQPSCLQTKLQALIPVTTTQTPESLQSPAFWCIFAAVLGILFKGPETPVHQFLYILYQSRWKVADEDCPVRVCRCTCLYLLHLMLLTKQHCSGSTCKFECLSSACHAQPLPSILNWLLTHMKLHINAMCPAIVKHTDLVTYPRINLHVNAMCPAIVKHTDLITYPHKPAMPHSAEGCLTNQCAQDACGIHGSYQPNL